MKVVSMWLRGCLSVVLPVMDSLLIVLSLSIVNKRQEKNLCKTINFMLCEIIL